MATNILALPLAHITIEVANNEDWIDSLVFMVIQSGPPLEQLDLSGIAFTMHPRRRPECPRSSLPPQPAIRRSSSARRRTPAT